MEGEREDGSLKAGCYRVKDETGNWNWRLGKRVGVKIVSMIPGKKSLGYWCLRLAVGWRGKSVGEDPLTHLGIREERKRPQQVVCCGAGEDTVRLEDEKEIEDYLLFPWLE